MRGPLRKLEVTIPGRWYLALTIALGVVALISANNVLYLIESLLLSGLIFSGILSERTLSAVRVDIQRLPASARGSSPDRIRIHNLKKFPVFCLEIGEWRKGEFTPLAYVPRLGPQSQVTLPSRQIFESRGLHRWEGFAIATSYPFGFARKLKLVPSGGERIIWPPRLPSQRGKLHQALNPTDRSTQWQGQDHSEGEIRDYTPDDDYRQILWTLSAKGTDPVVRTQSAREKNPEVQLDLRADPGESFERRVVQAAHHFYASDEAAQTGTLILLEEAGRKRIQGKHRALNELAQVQPVGARKLQAG